MLKDLVRSSMANSLFFSLSFFFFVHFVNFVPSWLNL
jgi:hypothetical protein